MYVYSCDCKVVCGHSAGDLTPTTTPAYFPCAGALGNIAQALPLMWRLWLRVLHVHTMVRR